MPAPRVPGKAAQTTNPAGIAVKEKITGVDENPAVKMTAS
jgi:hypothetical protein